MRGRGKGSRPLSPSELIPRRYSRTGFLKRAGIAGALATAAGSLTRKGTGATMPMPKAPPKPAGALTPGQLATLTAIAARVVPTDATGPGATEAGAAGYINLSLAGWPDVRNSLAASYPGTSVTSQLPAYQAGLPAVDAYAQAKKGAPFASLSPTDQDAVLLDMQNGVATGFTGGSAAFFTTVRTHVLQGVLSDPYYGGNQNFIGWKWLRYPGLRMPVAPGDQALTPPLLNPMSAYDMGTFTSGPPTLKG